MASIIKSIIKSQTHLHPLNNPLYFSTSLFFRSLASSSLQNNNNKKKKVPLSTFFEEAVGLSPRTEDDKNILTETNELTKRFIELEREVRKLMITNPPETMKTNSLKVETEKRKSLHGLFSGEKGESKGDAKRKEGEEEQEIIKELSPAMAVFVNLLYEQGYFNDANFLPGKFDLGSLENRYARDYIKFASTRFGQDFQEIAKWLSGSELKKVALFGCPSLTRKLVFSAKRLRKFFVIQEDTVCAKCRIKDACKLANQNVWKCNSNHLQLVDVMAVITLYALDSVHPKLVVPNDITVSVSKLLEEIVKLSQTVTRGYIT